MLGTLLDPEHFMVRPLSASPWYRGVLRSHVYWFCPQRWSDVMVWTQGMGWSEALDWSWVGTQSGALELPFALDSEGVLVDHPVLHPVCPWCVTRVKITALDGRTFHGD